LGTTITKSRYCIRCDALLKWQCECPNHKIATWQREQVFQMGKRYRGKKAWEETHPDEEYIKSET